MNTVHIPESAMVLIVGDTHYAPSWPQLAKYTREKLGKSVDPRDPIYLISVGDTGIPYAQERAANCLRDMAKELKKCNAYLVAIRGNHDRAKWFDGRVIDERITLLADYSYVSYREKHILLIGGAASIDRYVQGKVDIGNLSEEEISQVNPPFVYDPDELPGPRPDMLPSQITTVISHDCPSLFFEKEAVAMLGDMASIDLGDKLSIELPVSRATLQEVWDTVRPKEWFFGHYHCSYQARISNTLFTCLRQNETYNL